MAIMAADDNAYTAVLYVMELIPTLPPTTEAVVEAPPVVLPAPPVSRGDETDFAIPVGTGEALQTPEISLSNLDS